MPTNVLRKLHAGYRAPQPRADAGTRIAVLTAGAVRVRLQLAATETADRIWRALPLYSNVETWGESVHFEIPVKSGRDRTARLNGVSGEFYFWVEDDRILVPFGPTPISRPGECRLPSPANVWAVALDDVGALRVIRAGSKIGLVAEHVPSSPISATGER